MEDPVSAALKKAVQGYVMPASAKKIIEHSQLLVLCGVTAAGKNTITQYLLSHVGFGYVVSYTTRAPRKNHGVMEQNGRDYWFVNSKQMLDLVKKQALVEVKIVHGETFYGTSIQSISNVLRAGKRPVSEIDVQGAEELTKAIPNLRPVFILPPDYDTWTKRLSTRGFMSSSEKQRRFKSAKMELETAINDRSFLFVINHEVEQTAVEIKSGIDASEAVQTKRRQHAKNLLKRIS